MEFPEGFDFGKSPAYVVGHEQAKLRIDATTVNGKLNLGVELPSAGGSMTARILYKWASSTQFARGSLLQMTVERWLRRSISISHGDELNKTEGEA